MIAWDKVCRPKVIGGLGLRKTEPTNKAFQCKLAWKIHTAEASLWVRSMRTKYLYEADLFHCPCRPTDSPVWKSIMKNRDLLKGGLIWKVGKGDKISFWLDNWVENRSLLDITGIARSDITNIDIQVGEFITPQGDWDVNLLNSTLNYHPIVQKILGTTLSVFPRDDSFC